MAHDGLHQLLPQKRLLNEDERATYSGSKSQCLSRHTAKTPHPEPYFHCQSTIVQENWPGIVEERWNSASDISMSASSNEAEVVANDKPGSESQASPDLCSPEPVEVCYGCIPNVCVEFQQSLPVPSNSLPSGDNVCILEVLPGPDYFVICTLSTDEMIGFINLKTSCTLKSLQHVGKVRLEIALKSSEWQVRQQTSSRPFTTIVEITVFGISSIADAVGQYLSAGDLFLQSPLYDTGAQYQNPHMLVFSDISEGESDSEDCRTGNMSIENTPKSTISTPTEGLFDVMNDLGQYEPFCPVKVDPRLTVELLHHQRAGVEFMIHRETGQFQPSKSLWCDEEDSTFAPCYRHVITGSKRHDPLAGPFGGILADEMGLGKTLTTLATILCTLENATTWLRNDTWGSFTRQRSKATVIVVPSEVLMNQWFDEIQTRIIPGTVVACKYHGRSRESQSESIQHIDIMLTTYATAMSELRRRKGLLHKTEFYRLVLDEAHNIRKSKTRQYVAVSEISAARRWCITGTPIQNKVDDLGALVSFLKVPFLEDPEVFRVHITNQTYSDTSNRFDNLRKLLGCICIRRTKAIGYFSGPIVDLLYLELSHAEAQSYNDIVRRHRARLDMAVSLGDNANASQQIFKAFHELRLFCNNGTPEAKETSCIEHERIKAHRDVKTRQEEDKGAHTSGEQDFHDFTNRQSSFQITPELSHTQLVPESISGDTMDSEAIQTTILSSKLSALSKRIVGQPPGEKCIVFSFWKTSLDLVAAILRRDNIPYLRIDGSVSSAERQRALCGFDNASERMVLLMTIGTGAVGLNLASATRVHILEPQWNPMIEQQAIGRALRLGQTKEVVVSRYIMKGTIEEHVVSSQAYKLQVALKSFEKHGSDGSVPEMAKLFNEIVPEV